MNEKRIDAIAFCFLVCLVSFITTVLYKGCKQYEERVAAEQADCKARGGVWLTHEYACVAGPR